MTGPVAIGIDIGGTQLRAATVTARGAIVSRTRRPTPVGDAERLVADIRSLIADLGPSLPVGIGIAGLVTPDGQVRYGPNIGIRDLSLAAQVASATTAGLSVVNDASAAALGEQRAGAAAGRRDVVLFTIGTGLGGGIVVGGELVVGHRGFAGELGHVIVVEGGRRCACGNRGCIEAYAAGSAIVTSARERLADAGVVTILRELPELTGPAVTEAARGGDATALAVLEEVGHWLGVAAANVVNALDPEVLLVGGGAAGAIADLVLPTARASMQERVLGSAWRDVPPIELAALGDDAGVIGAALHAAERHAHGVTW